MARRVFSRWGKCAEARTRLKAAGAAVDLARGERRDEGRLGAGPQGLRSGQAVCRLTTEKVGVAAKSIAVSPFTHLRDDTDSRIYGDGVQHEILSKLGLIHELSVKGRLSVGLPRDAQTSPRRQPQWAGRPICAATKEQVLPSCSARDPLLLPAATKPVGRAPPRTLMSGIFVSARRRRAGARGGTRPEAGAGGMAGACGRNRFATRSRVGDVRMSAERAVRSQRAGGAG
jgi:hypothetical protein